MAELRETPASEQLPADPGPNVDLSLKLGELKSSCDYWHFDGLSDDGSEALLIRFYANYPFSSNYFKHIGDENGVLNLKDLNRIFPAVSFGYSVGGATVLHAINEFDELELPVPVSDGVRYRIGRSSFQIDRADYGSGYVVHLDITAALHRQITAEIEWLSIESGPHISTLTGDVPLDAWDISTPRADVSGRITSLGRHGEVRKQYHFRGTGYVDHVRGRRTGKGMEGPRCWGRAHFPDSTIVFQHFGHQEEDNRPADLYIVHDGVIKRLTADCRVYDVTRDRSGLKVPRAMVMRSDDGIELEVKPVNTVQSGLFEVHMLSEITLNLADGKERHTLGLIEFSDPSRMKNPVYRFLSDLRTGKNGRSPLF